MKELAMIVCGIQYDITNKNYESISTFLKGISFEPLLKIISYNDYSIFTYCADGGYIEALLVIKENISDDIFLRAMQFNEYLVFRRFSQYLQKEYVQLHNFEEVSFTEEVKKILLKKNDSENKNLYGLVEKSVKGFNLFLEIDPGSMNKLELNILNNMPGDLKDIIHTVFIYTRSKLCGDAPIYSIIVQENTEKTFLERERSKESDFQQLSR